MGDLFTSYNLKVYLIWALFATTFGLFFEFGRNIFWNYIPLGVG